MTKPPQENSGSVAMFCPTCKSVLHVRVEKTSRKAACPECQAQVRIPSLEEIQQRRRKTLPTHDVGQYALAGKPGSEVKTEDYVEIICATCRARLHPDVKEKPYQIQCPDCFVKIRVPARAEIPKKPAQKRKRSEVGQYGLGEVHEPAQVYTSLMDVQAEIRHEKPDPPPRWTFFSGVFTFPWHKEVIVRWGFLSLGCVAVGLVAAIVLSLLQGAAGYASLVLVFFVLPAIWLSIWTFSYAAACCVTILEDTAAGNDRVVNWPGPNWREWAAQLFFLSYLALVTGAIGYGIGVVVEISDGSYRFAFGIVVFVIYPLVLLSSLEANSTWTPLTLPILKSVFGLWWGWLLFYGLALAVWGVWMGLVFLGLKFLGLFLAFLSTGPILAASLFIYARLLGRLAWRITTETTE